MSFGLGGMNFNPLGSKKWCMVRQACVQYNQRSMSDFNMAKNLCAMHMGFNSNEAQRNIQFNFILNFAGKEGYGTECASSYTFVLLDQIPT